MYDAPPVMSAHCSATCRSLLAAFLLSLLVAARVQAQDAATVLLQQEVLELKRVNQQLEQRIESLERQLAGQGGTAASRVPAPSGSTAATVAANLSWINAADWDRLKPGTPELEVVRILGVPNSMRSAANGRQVLYYAVEIGTGSFLSGSVTLADHRVVEVQKPVFR